MGFEGIETTEGKGGQNAGYQYCHLPKMFSKLFPEQKILDSCKLKELAGDNFIFDENGRKFSRRVGNIGGKGEIAHHEQFLLFPHCFKRLELATRKNQSLFGKP